MSTRRISFRTEQDGAALIELAASLAGLSVSEFCRTAAEVRAMVAIAVHRPDMVADWAEILGQADPAFERLVARARDRAGVADPPAEA